MTMHITLKEASPRKFRANPKDRGVGGKWGPADTYNISKNDREQSVKNWKDQGTLDPEFKALLKIGFDNAGTPFKIDDKGTDSTSVWLMAKMNDFGINNIDYEKVGKEVVDCDSSNLPTGIARLLNKICNDILEKCDAMGGAGSGLSFSGELGDDFDTVRLYIYYPSIDDPDPTPELYPTRKEIVDDSINKAKLITAYLKKMAPVINKESSRTFNEGKTNEADGGNVDLTDALDAYINKNDYAVTITGPVDRHFTVTLYDADGNVLDSETTTLYHAACYFRGTVEALHKGNTDSLIFYRG